MAKLLIALAIGSLGCVPPSANWSKVQAVVEKMSLAQLVGQMTQADVPQLMDDTNTVNSALVTEYNLGSILVSGNAVPDGKGHLFNDPTNHEEFLQATSDNWKDLASRLDQGIPIGDDYIIYPLLGTDAVHGNQHVLGVPLFPHNIGMAASHNPDNFYQAGFYTAESVLATGWNFAFAPTVAVSHNYYWGRHYETMGAEPAMTKLYAQKYTEGLQQDNGSGQWNGVLASVKHFLGDGATYYGVDEGNATVYDFQTFLSVNNAGYHGGKLACMGNVMASYSAVNRIPMSINTPLLDGVLKRGLFDNLTFDGFVISDYDAVGKIAVQGWPTTNFKMNDIVDPVITAVNAGIDMMMLAAFRGELTPVTYQKMLTEAVNSGSLSLDRVKEAVTRILGVKCSLGLIQGLEGCSERPSPSLKSNEDAAKAALKAAQESLVLLKNDNEAIPVPHEDIEYIVLIGERTVFEDYGNSVHVNTTYRDYDNIGAQCGGWSVSWQGYNGNTFWSGKNKEDSHATSILDSIIARFPNKTIYYHSYENSKDFKEVLKVRNDMKKRIQNNPKLKASNTLIIGVLAENPYAEGEGDVNNPFCKGGYNTEGCQYTPYFNAYLPDDQRTDLTIDYDRSSYQMIDFTRANDPKIPLVTVLLSGRPMIAGKAIDASDAFIAAWLPGTSGGEAIVSSIFNEYFFRSDANKTTNTLAVAWLKTEESLVRYPIYSKGKVPSISDPLYPIGHGIATSKKSPRTDFAVSLLVGFIFLIFT